MFEENEIKIEIAGKEIIFKTGKIARQANGAVTASCGETLVFASACAADEPAESPDFFPMRVDYQENFSAAGKTTGGFIKRQGRPSQKEILVARLMDRPLRPMFPEGYFNEVQVFTYVWSYDGVNAPEPLAICAASAALTISDIPLLKPVGAVRVGQINGEFVVNPTLEEQEESKLDLVIAGTEDAVLMIEGYCDFLTEEQVLEAIETGHSAIRTICHALAEWREKIGKEKKADKLILVPEATKKAVEEMAREKLGPALKIEEKLKREETMDAIKEEILETLAPKSDEEPQHKRYDVKTAFKKVSSQMMREMILKEKRRSDNRKTDEVRPIAIETSYLPRTHGSTIFTRGETQSVAVCTLGGDSMAQRYETLEGDDTFRFYLQYFFPPFSVGEVGRAGPPGRREIGHGKLAERSLQAILPAKEDFPYVIRLESNITESNGSSSMASVCGGCLCMLDAGVPLKRVISGIAMGLVLEGEDYTILSDILGIEDALGDMDFKITGDKEGITAFQMDIKVEGITVEIMRAALMQAKKGRIHILEKMLEACSGPKEMSRHAPRIETIRIKPSKIAEVIGPGGKQIRAIIEQTGVEINIDDDGNVCIASADLESIEEAKAIIAGITAEIEIGKTYKGKIKSVVPFGIFVEVLPGKEGLCHISEFDHTRVDKMENVAKEGDEVSVKVIEINERGQVKLSRRATLPKKEEANAQ